MKRNLRENTGIQLLLKKYRILFQIPENLYYYSHADFKIAEKKFLKFLLMEGEGQYLLESLKKEFFIWKKTLRSLISKTTLGEGRELTADISPVLPPKRKKGAAKNGGLPRKGDPGWTEGVGLRIGPQQNRITVLSEETVETAGVVRTEEISLCFKNKMSKNKAHVPCLFNS